ncbi:MAG: NAD(P)/FAD-dependent oxidoreductase [Verrucomicrobia bacterium]|nr:NAD(P)/FAD-dependent oxidoreductase [Verrucomicrobiota bacterium]MCF7708001.1 NAD(P)/FAD-dependent oxidoreductase [Verrucomicrobiota bacterium]
MKDIVILGAGTAGTIMANRLRKSVDRRSWNIKIIDQNPVHYYQPGFLFMPFGIYSDRDVEKPKRRFIPRDVEYIESSVDRVNAEKSRVMLSNGVEVSYDILIIATGVRTVPDQVEGMMGTDWRNRIFDFYTVDGAAALQEKLKDWRGGRLVMHVSEMPIKCPVAPLEFVFLADSWLSERGLREKTELVYVTPLSGAFTKPIAAGVLGHLLEEKRIKVVNDFNIGNVDNERHRIVSWDDKVVDYDLLVTVPTNMGDAAIERSGLGDEFNFVPTDRHTLQSKQHENIFVIGDATDLPTSKAGSVAHFESEVLGENILSYIKNAPLREEFDGHANCFIESGHGKGFLLDFNYTLEPVPGSFPIPGIGPFGLLKETRINHFGKMAFKWIYWNMLLKGLPLPGITQRMSYAGKKIPVGLAVPESA